jgi:hypothetical protein
MARPKQGDGKGLLIGCGAAGCLGIIGIIVVLFFVLGASGSSSSSDDGGKSAPSGRLKANVQKNVAGWKLKSTKPLEVSGSVDAIVVQYKKGSKLIEWAVAVFPTEERAQEHLLGVTRSVANDVSVTGEVVRIKDDKGNEIGLGSHFESNPEFLCYRIGKLMAVISGPRGDVVPFFRELP